MNSIQITGTLVEDPAPQDIQNGTEITRVVLLSDAPWTAKEGKPSYDIRLPIMLRGWCARMIAQNARAGMIIEVSGWLGVRQIDGAIYICGSWARIQNPEKAAYVKASTMPNWENDPDLSLG